MARSHPARPSRGDQTPCRYEAETGQHSACPQVAAGRRARAPRVPAPDPHGERWLSVTLSTCHAEAGDVREGRRLVRLLLLLVKRGFREGFSPRGGTRSRQPVDADSGPRVGEAIRVLGGFQPGVPAEEGSVSGQRSHRGYEGVWEPRVFKEARNPG